MAWKKCWKELDVIWCYQTKKRSKEVNTRNGYLQKKVHSSFGEDQMKVPRDARILIAQATKFDHKGSH